MEIFNTKVYGIEETLIRSGYPMSTEIEYMEYADDTELGSKSKGFQRLAKLGASRKARDTTALSRELSCNAILKLRLIGGRSSSGIISPTSSAAKARCTGSPI